MRTQIAQNANWDDLVFDGRNKEYGAYELRQSYNKMVIRASLSAFMFLLLILFSHNFAGLFKNDISVGQDKKPLTGVFEMPPPPMIEIIKPPLPPTVNPIRTMKRFEVPKLTNQLIEDEPLMPTQQELSQASLGSDNLEGNYQPASTIPIIPEPEKEENIVTFADQMPEFDGGQVSLAKFMKKNFRYPDHALRMNIEGKVFVSFIVNKDGTISNIAVAKGLGAGCDEEAIKLMTLMPKWKPGRQNGIIVKVRCIMPISFQIE